MLQGNRNKKSGASIIDKRVLSRFARGRRPGWFLIHNRRRFRDNDSFFTFPGLRPQIRNGVDAILLIEGGDEDKTFRIRFNPLFGLKNHLPSRLERLIF